MELGLRYASTLEFVTTSLMLSSGFPLTWPLVAFGMFCRMKFVQFSMLRFGRPGFKTDGSLATIGTMTMIPATIIHLIVGICQLGDPCVSRMLQEDACVSRGIRSDNLFRDVAGRFVAPMTIPMTFVLVLSLVALVTYGVCNSATRKRLQAFACRQLLSSGELEEFEAARKKQEEQKKEDFRRNYFEANEIVRIVKPASTVFGALATITDPHYIPDVKVLMQNASDGKVRKFKTICLDRLDCDPALEGQFQAGDVVQINEPVNEFHGQLATVHDAHSGEPRAVVKMEDGATKSYSWSDLQHEDASGLSVGAANSYRPRDIAHYQEMFGLDSNLWEQQDIKSKVKETEEKATFEFDEWLQSQTNQSAEANNGNIETIGIGIVPRNAYAEKEKEDLQGDDGARSLFDFRL